MAPPNPHQIDTLLAALLADADLPDWDRTAMSDQAVAERAIYHGVAGLLVSKENARAALPEDVTNRLKDEARAQEQTGSSWSPGWNADALRRFGKMVGWRPVAYPALDCPCTMGAAREASVPEE